MTHPHLLHATSAAWSLQAARAALTTRARTEAEWIAAERIETAGGLRSTVLGVRGGGGYGDPVGGAAMAAIRPPRPNRYALLAADIDAQLATLTPGRPDPLGTLLAGIPGLVPAVAQRLTVALRRLDDVIRRRLHLPADEWPLPGAPECPACRIRGLTAQTAAPSQAWTVVCPDRCQCAGDGCRCGMPVTAAGVPHIWTAQHPLVRRLLDRQEAA